MEWTDQDARAWAKAWQEPYMQKGLKFILKRVRPRRSTATVAQGFDLSPVFIKSAGFYEGSQEVLDFIELLGNGKFEAKPKFDLPEPFSHIISEENN
jgi:hypothetical protein